MFGRTNVYSDLRQRPDSYQLHFHPMDLYCLADNVYFIKQYQLSFHSITIVVENVRTSSTDDDVDIVEFCEHILGLSVIRTSCNVRNQNEMFFLNEM